METNINNKIDSFLTELLRCEPSNMYALNLKVLNGYRAGGSAADGDVDRIYTILRLSTLKRRFIGLDNLGNIRERGGGRADDARQKVKIGVLRLYTTVSEFMSKYRVQFDGEDRDLQVGHYTKLATLKYLIKGEETYQRMYNVQHLNDPREGKIFIDLIWDRLRQTNGARAQGSAKPFAERLLEAYQEDSRKSCVYIGSFTASLDSLPMWSRYGEDGKGCCLTVDAPRSFVSTDYIDMNSLYISDNEDSRRFMDNHYALYRVIYYPEVGQDGRNLFRNLTDLQSELKTSGGVSLQDNGPFWEKIHRLIDDLQEETHALLDVPEALGDGASPGRLTELLRCRQELREIERRRGTAPGDSGRLSKILDGSGTLCRDGRVGELAGKLIACFDGIGAQLDRIDPEYGDGGRFYDEAINIVMIILDQVRFLIKSGYYSDEREYRLIKYAADAECDDGRGAVPQLYFKMKTPIRYKRVCLGPKVENPESVAAYLTNKSNDKIEVTRSQVAYRD